MNVSHAWVHPVVEDTPTSELGDNANAQPWVKMKEIQGMAGTPCGLSLRLLQFVLAAAALFLVASIIDFPMSMSLLGVVWAIPRDLRMLFELWLQLDVNGIRRKSWGSLFFAIVWSIWKYIDELLFEGVSVNWEDFFEQLRHCWLSWSAETCQVSRVCLESGLSSDAHQDQCRLQKSGLRSGSVIDSQNMRTLIWWLCVEYLPCKNMFAIGGYLSDHIGVPKCFLIDFSSVNSISEAEFSAMEMSLQFVLEEEGGLVDELQICTFFTLLKEEYVSPWELRFLYNEVQNQKDWFKQVLVTFKRQSCFKWISKWHSLCVQC